MVEPADLRLYMLPSDTGACRFYRSALPAWTLADAGADAMICQHERFQIEPDVLADPSRLVVIQRAIKPRYQQAMRKFTTEGRPWVYDFDDDFWALDDSNPASAFYKNPITRGILDWMVENATVVTVSTEPLAATVRAMFPEVTVYVVPNALHLSAIAPNPVDDRPHTVLWRGSQTHIRDVQIVRYALKKLDRMGVRIVFAGADYRKELGVPKAVLLDDLLLRHEDERWRTEAKAHRKGGRIQLSPDVYLEAIRQVVRPTIALAPLVDTRFNESKCLDVDTVVSIRGAGNVPIGEVVGGDEILTRNGYRKVLATTLEPERQGLGLTLDNGAVVKVTPEHRLLVNGAWAEAETIAVGDKLSVGPVGTGKRQSVRFNLFNSQRSSRPAEIGSSAPLVEIDECWGEFLGFFAGDGSASSPTSVCISTDGQDPDVIERCVELFASFGVTARVAQKTTYDGTPLRRSAVLGASTMLQDFLEVLGVVTTRDVHTRAGRRRVVCVPDVIMRSADDVAAAFLRGYFEADGHNTASGVECSSKDESFLRDVQVLLMRFGIQATLRSYPGPRLKASDGGSGKVSREHLDYSDRYYWKLNLKRRSADLFREHIGFVGSRKNTILFRNGAKKPSNACLPIPTELQVVGISGATLVPVDLMVDGEEFVAQGIVSHNSHIAALEAHATGAVPICSDVPAFAPYLRGLNAGLLVRNNEHNWWNAIRDVLDMTDAERQTIVDRGASVAEMTSTTSLIPTYTRAYSAASGADDV